MPLHGPEWHLPRTRKDSDKEGFSMRIQQTDTILKEAKISRKHVAADAPKPNVFARAWKAITSLFHHS